MLGDKSLRDNARENRRRSDNPRNSQASGSDALSNRHQSSAATVVEDHLERNVAENFLTESKQFEGFVYMMRHSDHPLAKQLRDTLFPSLTLALEATMKRAVEHQMAKEAAAGVIRKSISSVKSKLYRNQAFFPEGDMNSAATDFDAVKILAEELRKVHRERKPSSSSNTE